MRRLRSVFSAALAILGLSIAACNAITGASAYTDGERCTGPTCGKCASGQIVDGTSGNCVPCASGEQACGSKCCAAGHACQDPATGACSPCATTEAACGTACCGVGQVCLDATASTCAQDCGLGTRCGAMCCGAGQRCDATAGTCVQDCTTLGLKNCAMSCCGTAQTCADEAEGTCACDPSAGAAGTTVCGSTCCGGFAPNCVTVAGIRRCSGCTESSLECGPTCCVKGETCVDPALGVCNGQPFGASKQSCAGGLVCPVPDGNGGTEMADCCESIVVPGATFTMGGTKDPMDGFVWPVIGLVPYVATVSTYSLDRFEVTVGRFRAFVAAYDAVVAGGGIPDGAGRNPNVAVPFLPRGSGWAEEWNAVLPLTSSDLVKQVTLLSSCPYTKAPGSNERKPMGCMTWYQAFAFCAWDGGRLPTEAEWEMAATNGSANTNFPWGDSPVPDASHALFGPGAGTGNVGSKPAGANALGHRDLGGNVAEWVVDRYFDYPTSPSTNYAKSGQDHDRVFRGGSASDLAYALRAASRNYDVPSLIADSVGLRCARTP